PHLGYSAAVVEEVVRHLAEQAVGAEVDDWRVLLGSLGREWLSCAPAVAGLEVALLDLVAKVHHLPLYRYLGGAFRDQVPILRILPLKSPEETAEGAVRLVEAGFSYLKIKLENRDMALDIARIRAVREAVGPKVHLTLDANQSYRPKEAVRLWEAIGELGIDLFEQPVPARDFEGLKFVTKRVGCLVEADESAESLEDIWRLGEMRAVDCVSLKVLKLGGPSKLAQAAAICEQAGIGYRIGATVGTQLLNAAAMHLAATFPSLSYACELGEYLRLTNDPFGGLDLRDGVLFLPQGEGLGVSLTAKAAME
ncbi:MAG: hypothetical protein K6U87_10310, partial [Firmicutes bacterium]|nr:hypothetical protein [Bacillota bacterium]